MFWNKVNDDGLILEREKLIASLDKLKVTDPEYDKTIQAIKVITDTLAKSNEASAKWTNILGSFGLVLGTGALALFTGGLGKIVPLSGTLFSRFIKQ